MTIPRCLHCAIWDAVREHATAHGHVDPESGLPVVDRKLLGFMLTELFIEALTSGGDHIERAAAIEVFADRSLTFARCPTTQPRSDLLLVTRQ